jgi:hypothetical protein
MSAAGKSREQIRALIDTLEALDGVCSAINDVETVEFEPGERNVFKLAIADAKDRAVAFSHGLDITTLLIGLRAMQAELNARAGAPVGAAA